ncbi:hypothetical protein Tco_1570642 [Tanacetum coccineum]
MYKEYLAEFWYSAKTLENSKVSFFVPTGGIYGEVSVNTFRNSIGADYLPHSREYVAPPSIDIVRPWFETIGYGETVPVKGTLKKSLLPPKWRLLMAQIIQCLGGKTGGFDQITNKDAIILYSLANEINIEYANEGRLWSGELHSTPLMSFSINNWEHEANQPEEPLFTNHMLAICSATELVVFKAPKTSFNAERVPQGTKPGAKPGYKKHSTSSKQPFVSIKEVTEGGSSKAPTSYKTGHSKKRKESSSAIDSNPSQPPVSTPIDTGMHKEDRQATGGPTSLGVTSEARANPRLSSGVSTFNLNKPIYSASFIIHSESASGNDASVVSIAEADLGNSDPSDFVPQQQGMNKGTKNTSYNHLFAGTDPHVLVDQTKSVSKGLETVLTHLITGKGVSSIARQVEEEEASSTIKLEDLEKLVSNMQPSFKDLDSPGDDPVIVVDDSDKDEEDEVYPTTNAKTEDTSVPKSSSPSSLPTELKGLPSKFNELTEEVKGLKKQVHELEFKLPRGLKRNPTKLEDFTKNVASVQAKLKPLDALPSLLLNVTKALNKFAEVLDSSNLEAGDPSVSLADKGIKAMSLEEVEKESTNSGSNDDDETHVIGSIKLEEDAKAEAAKQEGEIRKAKLVDQLGPEVVNIANKRLKSSIQYKDHPAGTVLNEPVLVSALQVLRRLGSIFTSVYDAVYKTGKRLLYVKRNKAISLGKGKVYKAGKRFLDVKRNKAISLGKGSSKVADKDEGLHATSNIETEDSSVPKSSSPRAKKQVHELEIEMLGNLKEISTKLEDFNKTVTVEMIQAKLKTLDALLSLLNKVKNTLNCFARAIASKKLKMLVFLQQAKLALNLLRGRRTQIKPPSLSYFKEKLQRMQNLTIHNLKTKHQPRQGPIIPPVITTTTTQMQSPFLQSLQKGPSQPKGEHIKKDKGKNVIYLEEAKKESTNSDSDDDDSHLTGSMVEPSRIKKKIEEYAKAKAAKRKSKVRKEELVDLLGPEVVNKYYNAKLQYDRYCDKMLNRRAESRITNCDVLDQKGSNYT